MQTLVYPVIKRLYRLYRFITVIPFFDTVYIPFYNGLYSLITGYTSVCTSVCTQAKSCGPTVALDGSEDDHIHCFKEDQPCHSGLPQMKTVQHAITQSRERDPLD